MISKKNRYILVLCILASGYQALASSHRRKSGFSWHPSLSTVFMVGTTAGLIGVSYLYAKTRLELSKEIDRCADLSSSLKKKTVDYDGYEYLKSQYNSLVPLYNNRDKVCEAQKTKLDALEKKYAEQARCISDFIKNYDARELYSELGHAHTRVNAAMGPIDILRCYKKAYGFGRMVVVVIACDCLYFLDENRLSQVRNLGCRTSYAVDDSLKFWAGRLSLLSCDVNPCDHLWRKNNDTLVQNDVHYNFDSNSGEYLSSPSDGSRKLDWTKPWHALFSNNRYVWYTDSESGLRLLCRCNDHQYNALQCKLCRVEILGDGLTTDKTDPNKVLAFFELASGKELYLPKDLLEPKEETTSKTNAS